MIKLIAIGKNKDKALQSLEKEYMKRLSAFFNKLSTTSILLDTLDPPMIATNG